MSSESKKKRGASGQTNAKNNPWRINGWAPDWQARARGVNRVPGASSSGSTLMRGILGGVIVQILGRGNMVGDYEMAIDHAQARVTHPYLQTDEAETSQ